MRCCSSGRHKQWSAQRFLIGPIQLSQARQRASTAAACMSIIMACKTIEFNSLENAWFASCVFCAWHQRGVLWHSNHLQTQPRHPRIHPLLLLTLPPNPTYHPWPPRLANPRHRLPPLYQPCLLNHRTSPRTIRQTSRRTIRHSNLP